MDYSTEQNIALERYMGFWYEIARFNHRFEKGLQGVTATYTLLDNGKINVNNAGYKGSLKGNFTSSYAKAKIKNPAVPGHLKVFFIPFFGADYLILELDPNYQWALVGSSTPNYLWILSRTPQMDDSLYQNILEKAKQRGYAIEKLIRVEQPNE